MPRVNLEARAPKYPKINIVSAGYHLENIRTRLSESATRQRRRLVTKCIRCQARPLGWLHGYLTALRLRFHKVQRPGPCTRDPQNDRILRITPW